MENAWTLFAARSTPYIQPMPDPTWNTPARLDGVRPKTKAARRRGRSTITGTFGELMEIWLGLPDHEKQDCSMGWGPDENDHRGSMSAKVLARYAERNGLPPQMAARYQNAAAALAIMLKVPAPDFRPRTEPINDAAHLAQAPAHSRKRKSPASFRRGA